MRRILMGLFICLSFGGCATVNLNRLTGSYLSRCFGPQIDVATFTITLNEDHTFGYSFVAPDEPYLIGRWEIKRDTLILYSPDFEREIISMEEFWKLLEEEPDRDDFPPLENGQYTDQIKRDVYLLRGRRLSPLMRLEENKAKESCTLIKRRDVLRYYQNNRLRQFMRATK